MRLSSKLIRKAYFFKYNISPFRLRLVASHIKKRFLSSIGLRRGFRIIDLALTYDCNQNCVHCSASPLKKGSKTLQLDDYHDLVKQAKQLDLLSWNITGGEPLLVPWLEDLVRILEPRAHYISIQTNCLLLDKGRAVKLSRSGVNCITTSLDSINPSEHDDFRRSPDAFRKTLEGIHNARLAGMQVLIGGTVTHQNLRSRELIDLIKKANQLGAIFLFNLAVPCGNWKEKNDVLLRGDDRDYLLRLMDRYPKTTTDHEVGRNAVGCPAGMEKIYITSYGDVLPCPFIHVSFGNVFTTPLKEIISGMRKTEHFGSYQDKCIAAEDTEFQKNVMGKIYSPQGECPAPYDQIYRSH